MNSTDYKGLGGEKLWYQAAWAAPLRVQQYNWRRVVERIWREYAALMQAGS